jgi:hypothetical protein
MRSSPAHARVPRGPFRAFASRVGFEIRAPQIAANAVLRHCLRQVHLASQTFLTLNWPGIFLQYARHAHARISSSWHEPACTHGPACMSRHASHMNRHACCMHASCCMHEPACMLHAAAAAAACMRACVVTRVIGTTHVSGYQLIYSSAQTRAWRIQFSCRNIHESYARSKGRFRDTVSRARPFDRGNFREYVYLFVVRL